jgi:predicted DNA-binding transcriptional regulator YafY
MKLYPESAMRRAMKVMEVILQAIGKEIKWVQAADILGVTPRQIRRMRMAYQEQGIGGLIDKRRGQPSKRRAPYDLVDKVLCLC